jgi:hypothetical protein
MPGSTCQAAGSPALLLLLHAPPGQWLLALLLAVLLASLLALALLAMWWAELHLPALRMLRPALGALLLVHARADVGTLSAWLG